MLGADHRDTLIALNNLAKAYQEAGRLQEAIPLFEQTLADFERLRGADHPDTLIAQNNLADAYQSAGRLPEAARLLEQTLADFGRVVGPDHRNTLASRDNLAGLYQRMGPLQEAIELRQQALADFERCSAPIIPTPSSHWKMSPRSTRGWRPAGGDRAPSAGPGRFRAVLGADHPDTLTVRNNLAGADQEVGRLQEAIPLFEQTLATAAGARRRVSRHAYLTG